jgi:uncharacterized membrane protein YuzA (DUF378 family)
MLRPNFSYVDSVGYFSPRTQPVLATISPPAITLVYRKLSTGRIMKTFNVITLALVIIGGINWLLVGAFQFDLVAAVSGGQQAGIARLIYVIVGLSALWQIVPWIRTLSLDESRAQQARYP